MKEILALSGFLCLLAPAFARGAPAAEQWTNVYTNVRATFQNAYDIQDGALRILLYVNTYGNGLSFSGQPFSGSMNAYGNGWSLYAGGASASVSIWGANTGIEAHIPGRNGSPARFLRLTMYAQGPANDPNFPPSYSINDADCSLQITPAGASGYTISGRVNTTRVGPEGVAIVGLTISAIMQSRKSSAHGLPESDAIEERMRSDPQIAVPAG